MVKKLISSQKVEVIRQLIACFLKQSRAGPERFLTVQIFEPRKISKESKQFLENIFKQFSYSNVIFKHWIRQILAFFARQIYYTYIDRQNRPSKIWFIKKFIEFSIEVVRESKIGTVCTLHRVPSRLFKFVMKSKFVQIISEIQI